MNCDQVKHHLDAYVDRELDVQTAMSVRAHLAECASCRRRVAEREALGDMIRASPYYSAPDRLRARITGQLARSGSSRRMLAWAAAAVLAVSVTGAMALLTSARARDEGVVEQVVDGHVRALMADHLFDVQSTDRHTVKPWFLGKLDFSPPVADLAAIGFPLVGGRLDYVVGRPAAALVYQRRQHTINLFVYPEDSAAGAAVHGRRVRGFQVHHWVRDRMAFWVVSDLNDAELIQFVRALQAY